MRYETVRREGERSRAPGPSAWTARATGSGEQTLSSTSSTGAPPLVFMNADCSSASVRTSSDLVPFLPGSARLRSAGARCAARDPAAGAGLAHEGPALQPSGPYGGGTASRRAAVPSVSVSSGHYPRGDPPGRTRGHPRPGLPAGSSPAAVPPPQYPRRSTRRGVPPPEYAPPSTPPRAAAAADPPPPLGAVACRRAVSGASGAAAGGDRAAPAGHYEWALAV